MKKSEQLFLQDYWSRYKEILFNPENDCKLLTIRDKISEKNALGGKLLLFGNGASASLASHAATDFTKQAKIKALAFNDHNLITALSNDYGYENWVSKVIEFYADQNDLVIFISVSGNSKNLVNGLKTANQKLISSCSFTGNYKENQLFLNSDFGISVDSNAYNIVESIHTIWLTLIIDLFLGKAEYSVN